MTEADEKLARLFAAEASQPDPAFVDAVQARVRRARLARRTVHGIYTLVFGTLAVAAWSAWRAAKPVLAEVSAAIPASDLDVLGAPAPVLAIVTAAGLWIMFRRLVRAT